MADMANIRPRCAYLLLGIVIHIIALYIHHNKFSTSNLASILHSGNVSDTSVSLYREELKGSFNERYWGFSLATKTGLRL